MLRSLCLAAHHNACGLVGEAYGAVGFVDMLAAGTTGAKCVDLMGGGGGEWRSRSEGEVLVVKVKIRGCV